MQLGLALFSVSYVFVHWSAAIIDTGNWKIDQIETNATTPAEMDSNNKRMSATKQHRKNEIPCK
jgi:hypothetical protein